MNGPVRALVMAKAPVPGTVKTRLKLAPENAARLQKALLTDIVEKARTFVGPTTLAGTPPDRLDLLAPLLPVDVKLIPQVEGDLGRKMLTAAAELFGEAPGSVLILGADAPTLPPEYITRAVRALETHDASITPSADGGYVLLGLREPHEDLFSGIEWSTEVVYGQTLARAKSAGLSIHETEPWYDLDTPEDLRRLRAELSRRPNLSPRVAAELRNIQPLS